jgi:hypothetical protein
MNKRRSLRGTEIPIGPWSSDMTVGLPPTHDDAGLLALEVRFDDLVTELLAAQKSSGVSGRRPGERSRLEISGGCGTDCEADPEVVTERVEAVLARLHPIEQAIMRTPARTIAGLAVKARHAAYVMSEYWNAPIDRMDWDSRAVRLLIEAVCESAGVSLPCRQSAGDATPQ